MSFGYCFMPIQAAALSPHITTKDPIIAPCVAGALLHFRGSDAARRLGGPKRPRRDARAHRYARPEKSEAQLRELALKVELTKNKTLGPGRHRRFGGIHQWEGVRTLRPSFTRVEE